MNRVRVDKWLWAARFFKTRSLAARACELSRVQCNGQTAKPSRELSTGDLLEVKNDAGVFQIHVLLLSEVRGPSAVAQTLYLETEESEQLRHKVSEERKAMAQFETSQDGRPSKRNRREFDRLRDRL